MPHYFSSTRPARRHYFLLLAAMLACGSAWSCYVPPDSVRISADRHLAQARDVSVARVASATALGDGTFRFDFEVVKRLTGPDHQTFSVRGVESSVPVDVAPAGDHSDRRFLQSGGGRLHNDPDCIIRPSFVVGKSYLAFLGQPVTHLSFEEIPLVDGQPDPTDFWLRYVEFRLHSPPK
jgi:hypothetical protein